MTNIPTYAWVAYEDIYGRQIGPFVCAKDFLTEQEALDYKEKAKNPVKIAKLRFMANKRNYPEYFEQIDFQRDVPK